MRINKFQEFISSLSHISSSGYLTMNGEEYAITYRKNDKNLNTKQIVELAECYLSYMDKDRTSFWLHREKLSALSVALQVYSKRILKSKPKVWRALAFLGIRSWSEIKIYFLVLKIFIKIQLKHFNLQRVYKDIQDNLQKPEIILKEFYFKILGSSELQSKNLDLDGFGQADAFFSIIKDIHAFISQFSSSEHKALLVQIVNELHFAFEIAREDSRALNQFQKVEEIRKRLVNLPIASETNLEVLYTHLLLPGGYSGLSSLTGHGHAVNYQITRQINGLFSFRLIDSAKNNPALLDERLQVDQLACKSKMCTLEEKLSQTFDCSQQIILREELKNLKSTWQSLKDAKSSTDLVFKDLTLNQLSAKFFLELLEYRFNEKKCFSMDSLIEMIAKHFRGCVGVLEGRKHSLQVKGKGNCAMKSITLWLHSRWENNIHKQFKVYIGRQQMEKLSQLIKYSHAQFLENYFRDYMRQQSHSSAQDFDIWHLFQQMQRAGAGVLRAREAKLSN